MNFHFKRTNFSIIDTHTSAGVVRDLSNTQGGLRNNGQNLGILVINMSYKEWNINS